MTYLAALIIALVVAGPIVVWLESDHPDPPHRKPSRKPRR